MKSKIINTLTSYLSRIHVELLKILLKLYNVNLWFLETPKNLYFYNFQKNTVNVSLLNPDLDKVL